MAVFGASVQVRDGDAPRWLVSRHHAFPFRNMMCSPPLGCLHRVYTHRVHTPFSSPVVPRHRCRCFFRSSPDSRNVKKCQRVRLLAQCRGLTFHPPPPPPPQDACKESGHLPRVVAETVAWLDAHGMQPKVNQRRKNKKRHTHFPLLRPPTSRPKVPPESALRRRLCVRAGGGAREIKKKSNFQSIMLSSIPCRLDCPTEPCMCVGADATPNTATNPSCSLCCIFFTRKTKL